MRCASTRQQSLSPASGVSALLRRLVSVQPTSNEAMPINRVFHSSALLAVTFFACPACQARELDAPTALEDAKLYFTAPLRWDVSDWTYFGATALAVAAAHEYDDNVRSHFGTPIATGNPDPHSTRDWAPAAAMIGLTWAGAAFFDSRDGYEEGKAMVEAAAFSAVTTEVLKLGAGRRRPYETTRVDDWRDSGSSFPSSHASLTFAIGTVLAESGNEDFRWMRRVIGYGAASAVAYSRVHDGAHWLSDTVAGAALGIATGRFVTHRADGRSVPYAFGVQPMPRGAMLTYTYVFQ
jgi:membrane-associated phospholipid phosphatase